VTFHLADSLAGDALDRIEEELKTLTARRRDRERRMKIEVWIEAGHGSCDLRDPAVATMMRDCFLRSDGRRYRLLAWVIMPNHVHVLLRTIDGWTVAKIVATWKKYSARQILAHRMADSRTADHPIGANAKDADRVIGGTGRPVWHREYWDRFMRDEGHFLQALEYIHRNPVKAGLVATPEEWPWSSAYPGDADHPIGGDRVIGVPELSRARRGAAVGSRGRRRNIRGPAIPIPSRAASTMGYEVEIKFRAPDHSSLAARLAAIGAAPATEVEQEDVYLAHPSRDFAATGEAFRLRRDGTRNRVTYKGPKHAGPTKTREEVEVGFDDGAEARRDLMRVLEALGFRPVATVRKVRTPYHLERDGRAMEVVLDRVEGLGSFAEVEALAGTADLPEAQAAVLELARALGLEEVEPRSYLRMILERDGRIATNPAGGT
jgi:adenylate cyclase class 2